MGSNSAFVQTLHLVTLWSYSAFCQTFHLVTLWIWYHFMWSHSPFSQTLHIVTLFFFYQTLYLFTLWIQSHLHFVTHCIWSYSAFDPILFLVTLCTHTHFIKRAIIIWLSRSIIPYWPGPSQISVGAGWPCLGGCWRSVLACRTIEKKTRKSSLYLPALLLWLSLVEKSLVFKVSWQIESFTPQRVASFILYHFKLLMTFYYSIDQI